MNTQARYLLIIFSLVICITGCQTQRVAKAPENLASPTPLSTTLNPTTTSQLSPSLTPSKTSIPSPTPHATETPTSLPATATLKPIPSRTPTLVPPTETPIPDATATEEIVEKVSMEIIKEKLDTHMGKPSWPPQKIQSGEYSFPVVLANFRRTNIDLGGGNKVVIAADAFFYNSDGDYTIEQIQECSIPIWVQNEEMGLQLILANQSAVGWIANEVEIQAMFERVFTTNADDPNYVVGDTFLNLAAQEFDPGLIFDDGDMIDWNFMAQVQQSAGVSTEEIDLFVQSGNVDSLKKIDGKPWLFVTGVTVIGVDFWY